MNIWIKYAPLVYTWSTRVNKIGNSFFFKVLSYILYNISISLIILFYFLISGKVNLYLFFKGIFVYFFLLLIFSIFYEIGYIFNDIYSIKKEERPTHRVPLDLPINFRKKQIIFRLVLGTIGFILIYIYFNNLFFIFLVIILLLGIVYFFHNYIRNYFYNFITFLLLRILKFSIIIPTLYFFLGNFDSPYYFYGFVVFLLFQYFDSLSVYNTKKGGDLLVEAGLGKYFYLFISNLLFAGFTNNSLFLIYSFLFLLCFFTRTPKKIFFGKNP